MCVRNSPCRSLLFPPRQQRQKTWLLLGRGDEWCQKTCWRVVDEVNDRPVGNPKRRFDEYSSKFSLSTKPRYVNPVGKSQYSRRWCLLALRQLRSIYRAPRPVLSFASCNAEPAHNTTKYFVPNLRWGCQSHRFAVNKGMSVSSGKQ
jgi:hypothetical protein